MAIIRAQISVIMCDAPEIKLFDKTANSDSIKKSADQNAKNLCAPLLHPGTSGTNATAAWVSIANQVKTLNQPLRLKLGINHLTK